MKKIFLLSLIFISHINFAIPPEAIELFDGKSFKGWHAHKGGPSPWTIKDGIIEIVPGSGDIETDLLFQDFHLHTEFYLPEMEDKTGQDRANSGIYLLGRYELQILDTHKNPTYPNGTCGALYKAIAPRVNAAKPALQWQTYDIFFRAPRVDKDEKLIQEGELSVYLNQILVIDQGKFSKPTGAQSKAKQFPKGPIRLQEHGAPVRFRNIWIVPNHSLP